MHPPPKRSAEVLDLMAAHRRAVAAAYACAGDEVLHRVFGMPVHEAPDGRLAVFAKPAPESLWTLATQEFPFDLGPGVKQHVVWHSNPTRDLETAELLVRRLFKGVPHEWFIHEPDCGACFCVQVASYED